MTDRTDEAVSFTHGVTDPRVVAEKVAEIIEEDPGARGFRISRWRPYSSDLKGPGYFLVSWEPRK